ncbi:hypothetical protein [Calothrix rhizosoleniae]|uniref:hypothetical protein n=1 Tax=Calothrix rhizosoleniae TaxID=888997 RepID=UPI000B4A0694|nr:hypothetical protein [Calothrix rhizosoleniae]
MTDRVSFSLARSVIYRARNFAGYIDDQSSGGLGFQDGFMTQMTCPSIIANDQQITGNKILMPIRFTVCFTHLETYSLKTTGITQGHYNIAPLRNS